MKIDIVDQNCVEDESPMQSLTVNIKEDSEVNSPSKQHLKIRRKKGLSTFFGNSSFELQSDKSVDYGLNSEQ